MHVGDGLKLPGLPLRKETTPVGDVGTAEVSVTVPLHVVGWFKAIDDGLQPTLVEVECFVTVRLNEPKLLAWDESPV